jgi:hypothetical protein
MAQLHLAEAVAEYVQRMTALYFVLWDRKGRTICNLHRDHIIGRPKLGDPVWKNCERFLLLDVSESFPNTPEAARRFQRNRREFARETSDAMMRFEMDLFDARFFQNALEVIGGRYIGLAWKEASPRSWPPHPYWSERAEDS